MQKALVRLFGAMTRPIDLVFSVLSVPAALLMLGYRRFGSQRLRWTTSVLRRIGVFPIRDHYYEPLFRNAHQRGSLSIDRKLPGIDFRDAEQLALLQSLDRADELRELALDKKSQDTSRFQMDNGSFVSGDADFLYQMVRWLKPRKIVEIGSGHSTKIANIAAKRNQAESGLATRHVCIEPYEMAWLESLGVEVIRKKVEDCDIDWANELNPGDLLFIDSSHMIRPQGDVLAEYLQIIPALKTGVYVHVHDIFTPKDYLPEWLVDNVWFWNEQYLLEALLSNQARYEIVAALNYLKHHHYDTLQQTCPYLTRDREPGSLYFKVR
jgi:predicted O-methyltransferase YrrM